jgi:cytochrome b involved in lipid metabolism
VRERKGDDNGIHQNRDREDDEDDDDDEGDDDHSRRGSGSSGTTSGSTGTGANTNTGTGTNTSTTTTFTLAQVAQHNTSASCYTVVSGSVYDVTSWISQHPGGASAIKNMCGIDASAAFNGQHGGQARPASELAGFKIGTLAQ